MKYHISNRSKHLSLGLLLLAAFEVIAGQAESNRVNLQVDMSLAPVRLAVARFQESGLRITDTNSDWIVTGAIDESLDSAEAYRIRQDGQRIMIVGGGAAGLVYGMSDVRNDLSQGITEIPDKDEAPHCVFRAVKFNLPWDSYRRGEALQQHIETCRDLAFWESFLDRMVENRFNALTLWNLHPFNYLVRLEKYPEANAMSDQEFAEWRQFWNALFGMAKDRGIETYLVNWNIFVSPEFAKAHDVATYSITGIYNTAGDTASVIKDYTRESVRAVIDEYPDLTGLGITLGEAMAEMTPEERQAWIVDTFFAGMKEASRKIKFIYRAPLSGGLRSGGDVGPHVERLTRNLLESVADVQTPIIIELKYNWSHGHSSPALYRVHGGPLTDAYWNPPPVNYKLAWMIRNEDFFILRWGQPDFIRDHIARNSQEHVAGYFVGSETYIPALDYFTAKPGVNWRYAFQRQWMFYKQWGHLLYNPQRPDAFFADAFERRFPGNGAALFQAQSLVGRVPLILATYWNASWDFTLYSEGMLGFRHDTRRVQLLPLEHLVARDPIDPALMNVAEFVDNETSGNAASDKKTPLEMADFMESFCAEAVRLAEPIDVGHDVNLMYEKTDVLTWAHLGFYFAHKLRAAVDYQRFVKTGCRDAHARAVEHLERATESWREVVALTSDVYKEVPLQHLTRNQDGIFHWSKIYREVKEELDRIKGAINPVPN